jgi:uncharacterized protein YecA (UPF0149 family)
VTEGYCSVCFRAKFPEKARELQREQQERSRKEESTSQSTKEALKRYEISQQRHEQMLYQEMKKKAFEDYQKQTNCQQAPLDPKIFHKVGRNDKCPCGSGKKFKVCLHFPSLFAYTLKVCHGK